MNTVEAKKLRDDAPFNPMLCGFVKYSCSFDTFYVNGDITLRENSRGKFTVAIGDDLNVCTMPDTMSEAKAFLRFFENKKLKVEDE